MVDSFLDRTICCGKTLALPTSLFFTSLHGVLFLIVAYGIWTLRWWAFPVGLVVQGMVIALALEGIVRWLALGQQAPIIWDALDLVFAAIQPVVGFIP